MEGYIGISWARELGEKGWEFSREKTAETKEELELGFYPNSHSVFHQGILQEQQS
jgi:hypothetical protein